MVISSVDSSDMGQFQCSVSYLDGYYTVTGSTATASLLREFREFVRKA